MDEERNQSNYLFNIDGTIKSKKLLLLQWLIIFHQTLALMRSSICSVLIGYNFLGLYRLDELTAKINDFTPDDPDLKSPSP